MANKTNRTIKFWSEKEKSKLLTLVKKGDKATEVVRQFSDMTGRSEKSVLLKVIKLRKELGLSRARIVKSTIGRPVGSKTKNTSVDPLNTSKERGVALPDGFVFNFTPKKAEMFENHVRLYF